MNEVPVRCHSEILPLLSAFSRALSHSLRTPLSVISNDLCYFETILKGTTCERARNRCQEIVGTLEQLSLNAEETAQRLPPALFFRLLNEAGFQIEPIEMKGSVVCFPGSLKHAFRLLMQFFLSYQNSAHGTLSRRTNYLNFTLRFAKKTIAPLYGTYPSLTAFLTLQSGGNSPFPPFFEAILLANGIQSRVEADSSETNYVLSIPLSYE